MTNRRAVILLLAVCACHDGEKKRAPLEACARVGQTCEVSPGKLGTCVTKDGCTEASPSCFVCQSQH